MPQLRMLPSALADLALRPDIHPGIRFLRRDKAAIWFLPLEHSRAIVVAAIFYGAQDHIRNMLARMLAG